MSGNLIRRIIKLGLVRIGESLLEPGVSELIHRADCSQDLTLTSIVKKPQQPCRSLVPTSQLCAG